MSVRTVTAGETRFLLREHGGGDGTPVLLLHGVPETSSLWRDLAPRLADGRRVLAPDLPGLGGSSYPGPYGVPALVAQLVALLEKEGTGRVDLVGHDWGGSLALALAGARPDLVRRLCIVNAPYREVPLLRAAHIPFFALPVVPELLFRLGGRRVVDAMLALAWKAPTALDPDVRAEYEAAYTDPGRVEAMLGYYRCVARPRFAALLPGRARPAAPPRVRAEQALVLWGALDPVLPISTGESVARDLGPECAMVTVPGAGHFVIEEAPEVVASVLLDFLADGRPAPAVSRERVSGEQGTGRRAVGRRAAGGVAPGKRAGTGPAKRKATPKKPPSAD